MEGENKSIGCHGMEPIMEPIEEAEEEELEVLGPGFPVIMNFLREFKRWAIGILIFIILFWFLLGFLFGWMVFA